MTPDDINTLRWLYANRTQSPKSEEFFQGCIALSKYPAELWVAELQKLKAEGLA